jgi:hypothetical protein
MNNKDRIQLMKFIYAVQNMGASNSMVKDYFDTDNELELYKPKNWLRYIREHINIIDGKEETTLKNIRVKKYEFKTKKN